MVVPFILSFYLSLFYSLQIYSAKEINSKIDLVQEESRSSYGKGLKPSGGGVGNGISDSGQIPIAREGDPGADTWPLSRPEVARIRNIHVKCEKNHMKVSIEFDRAFFGVIFSKGHYNEAKCIHLPSGSGHTMAKFDIFLGTCGTTSSDQGNYGTSHRPGSGLYIENTIIVQYDPQVQEIWDLARRLRCTWYDYYEKPVSFRPFNVDMMDAVTANFLGDNIQCWMQIQAGKGPWASEVTGIVKIGQTMTMVLAIKDDENKFDMLVRDCVAHDGKHAPIQLVDDFGCVTRPKIMSQFQKVKNFGSSATVVSYAYFQAFKFPDSMDVYFQCTVQVCRYECPEAKCSRSVGTDQSGGSNNNKIEIQVKSSSSQLDTSSIIHGKSSPIGPTAVAPPVDSMMTDDIAEESYHETDSRMDSENPKYVKPVRPSESPNSVTKKYGDNEHSSNTNQSRKHNVHSSGSASPSSSAPSSASKPSSPPSSQGLAMPRQMILRRSERQIKSSSIQFTDIRTEKVIHVLSPGDVSFLLPLEDNSGNNVSLNSNSGLAAYKLDIDENIVCFSRPSFILWILLLLTLVLLSSMSAFLLYCRARNYIQHSCRKNFITNSSSTGSASSSNGSVTSTIDGRRRAEECTNLAQCPQRFSKIPGFGLFHSPLRG